MKTASSKTFQIFKFAVIFQLAPKRTVWWLQQNENRHSPNQRVDALFALERFFIRSFKRYVYGLKIGRLQILVAHRGVK